MNPVRQSESFGTLYRIQRFLRKPWHEKAETLRIRWAGLQERWKDTSSNIRLPVRLQFGAWWLPRNDNLGEPLLAGTFETNELAFVDHFLRPGMTVLDLGAHQGLYTLLASKRVAPRGRVFAFEPSPRERRALRLHVMMNSCWNVSIQGTALGNENTEGNLFVVQGRQTGCNSLRPPDITGGTSLHRVRVTRLDNWLEDEKIERVDFVKLDVEGAELDVLRGAERLLDRKPRPVFLAEVQDVRTIPWGYHARDILIHLCNKEYSWFRLSKDGTPEHLNLDAQDIDGNFVACPREREPLRDLLSGF